MVRDDEFEKYFLSMFNKVMNAISSGAPGIRISIDPEGNVHIDPIRPRKRKIYVPFEVVDTGDKYLIVLDLRSMPKYGITIKVTPNGITVDTPKGERFIYLDEEVDPEGVKYTQNEGVVEIEVPKGKGATVKTINLPVSENERP